MDNKSNRRYCICVSCRHILPFLHTRETHSFPDTHMLGPPQDANLLRGLQRIGQALLQVRLPSDALHAHGEPLRVLHETVLEKLPPC